MAKGQKRSNRELRKPKKEKASALTPDAAFGDQLKTAQANIIRGKAKT
jgi:hypothetical protein